ncbi:hypothetical protein Lesp02_10500 [Lentzea sp. NBRC 105346]|uniref:S8 family peptidase n=1 Tax=Lentzea sp. NBRC 105346 TaxID=3032205 RepID=UPI0024A40508|nr:S8/S53 family peptidase [Lentzea sp. NBRC 105346]GLZ28860.1 hypothetical protein Lesp02_10500 [Lentzea sp. NBRC 105346]
MPDQPPLNYVPDQLVIDSTEEAVVLPELDDLQIKYSAVETIPEFDLKLLQLEYRADLEKKIDATPVLELDPILFELRRRFENSNQMPFLAKNRTISSRFGATPETQSHTDFDPAFIAPPATPLFAPSGGRGVRIGVLDTKIAKHDKLLDHIETRSPDPYLPYLPADSYVQLWEEGHATFVVGRILAAAPEATVVVRHVLDRKGEAPAWDTVKALAGFLADDVKILVLAMGCYTDDGKAPKIVARAVERLKSKMLIVAAAGNHGAVKGMKNGITKDSPTWPAALDDVTAVGAHTQTGALTEFSPRPLWVNCTALGEHVDSTYLTGDVRLREGGVVTFQGYARWEGTSFSAATVAGAIAVVMARDNVDAHEALKKAIAENGAVHKYP